VHHVTHPQQAHRQARIYPDRALSRHCDHLDSRGYPLPGLRSRPGERPPHSCASNLKQIALGFTQYTQDYDEKFPIDSGDIDSTPQTGMGWMYATQPYVKSVQIFQCPSESTPALPDDNVTDYWVNADIIDGSLASVQSSSNTLLNGDGFSGSGDNVLFSPTSSKPLTFNLNEAYARRHLEGANYSFVDGHVKWLKPTAISGAPTDGRNFTFSLN
jgi:prepilin-type processing-associated H-X9-DG protein